MITEQHREIAQQVRTRLMNLEATLRHEIDAGTMVEFDGGVLDHQFAPGVYMRTLSFKAGSLLVGKIHKHAHPNILSKGEVLVLTEGGGLEHLVGPVQMISPAGTKRAVYALQDTVWTTIHCNPTDTQDLELIENEVIAKTFEEYEQFSLTTTAKQIGNHK